MRLGKEHSVPKSPRHNDALRLTVRADFVEVTARAPCFCAVATNILIKQANLPLEVVSSVR